MCVFVHGHILICIVLLLLVLLLLLLYFPRHQAHKLHLSIEDRPPSNRFGQPRSFQRQPPSALSQSDKRKMGVVKATRGKVTERSSVFTAKQRRRSRLRLTLCIHCVFLAFVHRLGLLCLALTTRECTTVTASELERDPAWMKADRRGSTSRNGSVSSSASSEWGPTAPASRINTGE